MAPLLFDYVVPMIFVGNKSIWEQEEHTVVAAGRWLVEKARARAREDVQAAARNLRKQGVPLDLALTILLG